MATAGPRPATLQPPCAAAAATTTTAGAHPSSEAAPPSEPAEAALGPPYTLPPALSACWTADMRARLGDVVWVRWETETETQAGLLSCPHHSLAMMGFLCLFLLALLPLATRQASAWSVQWRTNGEPSRSYTASLPSFCHNPRRAASSRCTRRLLEGQRLRSFSSRHDFVVLCTLTLKLGLTVAGWRERLPAGTAVSCSVIFARRSTIHCKRSGAEGKGREIARGCWEDWSSHG